MELLELIYKNIEDGNSLAQHCRELSEIARKSLAYDTSAPKSVNTTFNVLRSIVRVLHKQLGYLNEPQAKEIERLIGKSDVAVGAAFEVYLQNTDLEDLTHSLLTILKASYLNQFDVDFSYRAKEQSKIQSIIKKLTTDVDKDSLYETLSHSRLIIDSYHNLVSSNANESPSTLARLADHLNERMSEFSAKQKSLAASLRTIRPMDRRRSFKEIHDEMQVIMMEYQDDLVVQDPEIYKSVACGEEKLALSALYEQIQTMNERVKIVALLNQLIEGYYASRHD